MIQLTSLCAFRTDSSIKPESCRLSSKASYGLLADCDRVAAESSIRTIDTRLDGYLCEMTKSSEWEAADSGDAAWRIRPPIPRPDSNKGM